MKCVLLVLHLLFVVGNVLVRAMKACGGVELQLQSLLISVPDVGKWSASCPDRFTAGTIAHATH